MESRNSTESQADPPAGVGSSRNRTTADEGPAGVCSSWSRSGTTAGEGPAGASSSQSWTTADCPAGLVLEGTRLLQINTLDTVPPGAIRLRMGGFSWSRVPWGLDCCEPGFRPCDFLLWQGRFFCRKVQSSWSWLWEPDYRRQLSWSGLSELDYRRHFLWEPDILRHVSGHEFWEQSRGSISYGSWGHCGCWSRFTKEPVCCGPTWGPPVGTDSSGQDQTQSAHKVAATDGADTTDRGSSVNQTQGTAEASSTADTVWVVSMAMHTTGDTGSQLSTQLTACCSHLYSSLLPRTVALERVPTEPWKRYQFSLQCQLMTEIRWCLLFPYRLWRVCIIHPAWRCPLLAWMWNTDHQTWQIRWEPATCNSKHRRSIWSNHHSSVHWTSRYYFPHRNLCSSPQLLLVHQASRLRMLSPWCQPRGGWWITFYKSSVWLSQLWTWNA